MCKRFLRLGIYFRVVAFTVVLVVTAMFAIPAFTQAGVDVGNDNNPVKDQVPCLLTQDQNYGMHGYFPKLEQSAQATAQNALNRASTLVQQSDPTSQIKAAALKEYAAELQTPANRDLRGLEFLQKIPDIQNVVVGKVAGNPKNREEAKNAQVDTSSVAKDEISDKSLNANPITSFSRPNNVSCSMSIFPWDETHKVFGRTVADTYLAVQLTVRNLDQENEYLIHDAELAVEANSAQLERFQVGHEKEVVRNVLTYGQSYDRQHIFINITDGIGTILGAIVGLPAPTIDVLTEATGAYHAGFLPVIHNLFPDLTTKNLNALNDLGYSAAAASRVVVPAKGSVPFVVFIPIRPLEQACWLQKSYKILTDKAPNEPFDACSGIDADSLKWKEVKYKNWKPLQIQAMEKHAYALVDGVFIKELNNQGATLKNVVCAEKKDTSGAYLAYTPNTALNCTLSGSDLDTAAKLRLRSSAEPKTNLDATVTVSGDNSTATAVLGASDFQKIDQSAYELYSVDKSGAENDLKQTMNFRLPPSITNGQSIPAAPGIVTLNGSHLTGVSKIVFYQSGKQQAEVDVTNATDLTLQFNLNGKPISAPGQYDIHLILDDGSGTDYTVPTITVAQL